MAQSMTASERKPITDGQIEDLLAKTKAAIIKNRSDFTSEISQLALGTDNFGMRMLAKYREIYGEAEKDFARKAMLGSLVKNEHGHYTFDIVGLGLTGEAEIARLTADNYRVSDWAKSCLTSTKKDGYDAKHRLVHGQTHKIAFVFGREIERDSDRTTTGLQTFAGKFGYQKPVAGIMPRIRETVSDELMKDLDIWYIAALHDPIKDSGGDPGVLDAYRGGGGRWLRTHWGDPYGDWSTLGAFAFLVPASTQK